MITVDELNNGRSGDAFSRGIEYRVIGTGADAAMDEAQAIQAVVAATTETRMGLYRTNAQLNGFWLMPDKTLAKVTMQWAELDGGGSTAALPGGAEATYEFSYQAASAHIWHALATTRYGTNAPNYGDKIYVTPEGEHLGLDLPEGNQTNNYRLTVPNGFVTSGYEALVENMVGSVNSATFKGRPAGSYRFVSCNSTQTRGGTMSIAWGFAFVANRTGLTLGGISGVAIKGHELWWMLDKKTIDIAAKKMILQARGVYVHQVFPTADFSLLGF